MLPARGVSGSLLPSRGVSGITVTFQRRFPNNYYPQPTPPLEAFLEQLLPPTGVTHTTDVTRRRFRVRYYNPEASPAALLNPPPPRGVSGTAVALTYAVAQRLFASRSSYLGLRSKRKIRSSLISGN